MILSALLSFLGGSTMRAAWGEVAAYFSKRQEHAQELERMRLQADLEAQRFERDIARLKLSSELGIKEVEVKGDIDAELKSADAFIEAQRHFAKPSGIKYVDAWNGSIRPAAASIVLMLWVLILYRQDFTPSEWDVSIMGMILGFFFASREFTKRGK